MMTKERGRGKLRESDQLSVITIFKKPHNFSGFLFCALRDSYVRVRNCFAELFEELFFFLANSVLLLSKFGASENRFHDKSARVGF